ncbi:MAG: c-type cytochrome [Polyangiaceae bacterium]|nr:c-type cytochrome [Polyangiaceae bacterium]
MRRAPRRSAGRSRVDVFAMFAVATACSEEPAHPGGSGGAVASGGGHGGTHQDGGASSGGGEPVAGSDEGGGGARIAPFEEGEDQPGGDTTTPTRDASSFLQPAANLSPERRGTFEAGLALFDVAWTNGGDPDRDGLGPTYIGTSCQSCHFRGGRGAPPLPGQPMTSMLVRLSVPANGKYGPDARYGDQLQNRAIAGVEPEGWFSVDFEPSRSNFEDGSEFELLAPKYTAHDLAFGPLAEDTKLSARVAQPMIGLGLLAAIGDEDIEQLADPDDIDGDGIRGRRNHLDGGPGRFGWKANQRDLATQTAAAFLFDMGITSSQRPNDDCPAPQLECGAHAGVELDIDDPKLDAVVFFSHLVAVPHRPDARDDGVLRGKAVFEDAGCTSCHTPSFRTGAIARFPELEDQLIFPYTDMLLHDMGEGLADERPDGAASGRDFRTPPLWGIGVAAEVSGHGRLLHDGRARSIEEAILWHGGEAEASRARYVESSAADRDALLRFVESL